MKLQPIENRIHEIRGENVMFDFDLAEIYGVETRVLKQAVRRNMERFPNDFMCELTKNQGNEFNTNYDNILKNIKFSPSTPIVFTEKGVAIVMSVMLSSM